ncbi:MAG: hypothetical protein FJ147_16820 [Deltaproteobacteria bacterium]|nr:hypothetical protein [Deltaproteobacteria bacterium]
MSSSHDPQLTAPSSVEISRRERLHTLNATTSAEADTLAAQGQQATYRALVWTPFSTFVRVYVRQGEWRHGISGLIAALFAAYGVFIRFSKLWEQQNVKTTIPPPSQS